MTGRNASHDFFSPAQFTETWSGIDRELLVPGSALKIFSVIVEESFPNCKVTRQHESSEEVVYRIENPKADVMTLHLHDEGIKDLLVFPRRVKGSEDTDASGHLHCKLQHVYQLYPLFRKTIERMGANFAAENGALSTYVDKKQNQLGGLGAQRLLAFCQTLFSERNAPPLFSVIPPASRKTA